MDSTNTASLDIPELSATAAVAHVFPSMANNSLLSVRQLCNEGYSVTFTIDNVTIFNKIGKEILKGIRDLDTGLWRINLRKEIQHNTIASANNMYELRNTGALVNYLHKAMFIPTKAALLKAVKQGHLATWPGITEDAINKHLKLTPDTAMGHMHKKRQNIRSTSKAVAIASDLEDTTVTPAGTGEKTHFVYAAVIDQGQLCTDITGRFTQLSSRGSWYVMVVYSFDCN
jgi:DNA polymerase/3'-5' exonuclease PolX